MPLAYHKDVPTELYVPIAFAVLGVLAFLLYKGLREPPLGDAGGRSNWPAKAAIVLGLAAIAAATLAWFIPIEAESGVRRTIADVGIVIALVYALVVGPLLGLVGITLVRSRGHRRQAIFGFLFGFVGLAWAVGTMVACIVSDGCFH
jgi:FtsH-binding integral membrane protein